MAHWHLLRMIIVENSVIGEVNEEPFMISSYGAPEI